MSTTRLCKLILASCFAGLASGHGALCTFPRHETSIDQMLPEFEGGKSPSEACTCNNGNGGPKGPTEGCDMGLRGGVDGKGDGQACLWWSQGCSIGCDTWAALDLEYAGLRRGALPPLLEAVEEETVRSCGT